MASLLRGAEIAATKLLREHRTDLDRVIDLLLERETIDGSELDFISGAPKHPGQRELVLLHSSVGLISAADRGDAAGPV